MKPYKNYHETLIEDLKNPREAAGYLNASLEDGDKEAFLLALRQVLEAQGGMTKFSRRSRMNRVSLYKMLSKNGNPEWDSIIRLLKTLKIRFRIVAEQQSKRNTT